MFRLISYAVLCFGLIGCVQTEQERSDTPDSSVVSTTEEAPAQVTQFEPFDLKWLEYADPVADANLAIANQNFTLLAFTNRGLRLPGVDEQDYNLDKVSEICGVKVVKGTGDSLEPGSDLTRRKKLRAYATDYNEVAFKACQSLINSSQR